jgi:hypothetical protein
VGSQPVQDEDIMSAVRGIGGVNSSVLIAVQVVLVVAGEVDVATLMACKLRGPY